MSSRARSGAGNGGRAKRKALSLAGRFAQPSGLLSTPEACAATTAVGGLTASQMSPIKKN